jgi:hypothetical protein
MNYFNEKILYIFMKILKLSKFIRNDKTFKKYTSFIDISILLISYVFQTRAKTTIIYRSQIKSQIM